MLAEVYLGVCQLPGPGVLHHDSDIIAGSLQRARLRPALASPAFHFNRSMRALAKTKGMSLQSMLCA